MAAVKAALPAALSLLLGACSGCGKLADADSGVEASTLDAPTMDTGPQLQETCNAGPSTGVTDAAAGTPNTITCPVGWHCDYNGSPTGVTPVGVCCPAGHTDHPDYDPACAYCQCAATCCPSGFSCASWDAAPPICDGG
jgi:hypothetical protein